MLHNLLFIRSLAARNWMLDIRFLAAISYDDQQWLIECWMPRALKLPLQKVAIVQSFNDYNNMVIEDVLRYTPGKLGCEVQLFTDCEASLDWIQDVSENSYWMRPNTAC